MKLFRMNVDQRHRYVLVSARGAGDPKVCRDPKTSRMLTFVVVSWAWIPFLRQ